MPEPGRPGGPLHGFYREDVDRLRATVRWSEGLQRNAGPGGARTPVVNGGPVPAYTKTGGFAAGSKTSPSSATVTLAVPGTGNALADGDDVEMWNYSTRAITTAGKLIFLTYFNGRYCFLVGDC